MAITVDGTLLKEATLGTSLVTKLAAEKAFADLGIVLKFVGVSTTDPTQGATIEGVDKFETGNICLFNKKEFLATVTDDVVTWVEIGDDDLRTIVEELQNSKADKLQDGFGTDVVINTYTSKIVKDGETIVVDWNGEYAYHTLYFPLIDIDYHNENSAYLKPFAYRMRFRYIPFATGVEASKELCFLFPNCLISVVGDGGLGIDYRIDSVVVYANDTPLEFDISLYKSPSLPDYLPQVVMRITKLDGSPSVADELKAQINAANAILEEIV